MNGVEADEKPRHVVRLPVVLVQVVRSLQGWVATLGDCAELTACTANLESFRCGHDVNFRNNPQIALDSLLMPIHQTGTLTSFGDHFR
ncbi:hypothetical protein [Schlesneria sp. T3-172]|uniref:hypothetical protein n=1 Tax=Schlesneria sphaerica TaxID=3373610 RepID=UPI0037CC2CA7